MILISFFHVLGEQQFQYIFKLTEDNLKMPVWKYNDKCYLKANDKLLLDTELIYVMKLPNVKLNYLVVQNMCLTLWIYHFIKKNLKKQESKSKDIQFLKLIKQ